MKLRNKKTGEIIDIDIIENRKDGSWEWQAGKTLHDLTEEWEDYKPVEPLIKDEKIRKAVRAWAEANKAIEVMIRYDNSRIGFYSAKADSVIEFADDVDISCNDGDFYTLAELCGEEECES